MINNGRVKVMIDEGEIPLKSTIINEAHEWLLRLRLKYQISMLKTEKEN